jgi:hypothetical protein
MIKLRGKVPVLKTEAAEPGSVKWICRINLVLWVPRYSKNMEARRPLLGQRFAHESI